MDEVTTTISCSNEQKATSRTSGGVSCSRTLIWAPCVRLATNFPVAPAKTGAGRAIPTMLRTVEENDTGMKILYEPRRITVDIVFIHGIGAHPDDTWSKNIGSETEPCYVNWLSAEEMLPKAVPDARIMRYGYMSEWFGDNAIRVNVSTVADRFLRALKREREDTSCTTRPLLFVAHCFGGLVVLSALVQAERKAANWPNIYHTVTGIVFLGTPFRGAEQLGQIQLIKAAKKKHGDMVQSEVLRVTGQGDELRQQLLREFEELRERSESKTMITCFFELIPCDIMAILGIKGKKSLRVDESAGSLDRAECIGLQRTHYNMQKFGKPNEEEYLVVRDEIRKMVKAAPDLLNTPRSQSIPGYRQETNEGLSRFNVTGANINGVAGNVDARQFNAGGDINGSNKRMNIRRTR